MGFHSAFIHPDVALSLHLCKKAGKDGQKIVDHASAGLTKHYQRELDDII